MTQQTEERAAGRLNIGPESSPSEVVDTVREWVSANVPEAWQEAGRRGGALAVRQVRTRDEYAKWYPVFADSGLVVPNWSVSYGGLDLPVEMVRLIETELRPFNLGRLNPLGLAQAAPALFGFGNEEQRLRFLPPMVRNDIKWCQLFSEPGAGSDLASLATRAERDGDEWVVDGQKVWTTWAHMSDMAVLIARTDPDLPKRRGITYFMIDLHQPGIEIRPLRHIGGEVEFNEVFMTAARVPDANRVGEVGHGWAVANATLAGERQMVSGGGGGGPNRVGGAGVGHLVDLAKRRSAAGRPGGWDDRVVREDLMKLYSEERIRAWTNERARSQRRAGRGAGAESSIGKIHQGDLNQRMQVAAANLLGLDGLAALPTGGGYAEDLPYEVKGMLRSRANTIEGGTSEINKNVVGERVLGLPREPDAFLEAPWRDVPRS